MGIRKITIERVGRSGILKLKREIILEKSTSMEMRFERKEKLTPHAYNQQILSEFKSLQDNKIFM